MPNEIYEASEIYLRTRIRNPSLRKVSVNKEERDKNLVATVFKDQRITEEFQGAKVTWELTCIVRNSRYEGRVEENFFELSFHSKHRDLIIDSYLPYVLERSKAITAENNSLRIYSHDMDGDGDDDGRHWTSVNLDHPSTFDTIAMDANLKTELLQDLDRFVQRKDFYRRVGKAWKRGYLLYGPPGTGKSSLIAAMANHLNFNIYDLELTSIKSNSELRRMLLETKNRSILVIEDIDCTVNFHERKTTESASSDTNKPGKKKKKSKEVTLSGVLNTIDGLWPSCGDERVIVFTTNHKEKLDPALLRPGRMDKHILMSYCTPCGFKVLAYNYLQVQSHPMFQEVESLLSEVNATPAEIAEELMKSDDPKTSLQGIIDFLQNKKMNTDNTTAEEINKDDAESVEVGDESEDSESSDGSD
ncbi:hypothetical protein ACHQM5_015294 [Ranunculus cassubicifolius]